MKIFSVLILIFVLFFSGSSLYAQIDLKEVDAEYEFQWGLISYHRGEFNKSILSLEKSLLLKPGWEKTKLWLGHAYYRAGFTDAAIGYWEDLLSSGGGTLDLKVKVDNLNYLRSMGPELQKEVQFVSFHEISGVTDEYSIFKRPCSVFPSFDGGFYLSSFATNEIHKFSANGVIKSTFRGGVTGINHPFDIMETKDYLFISEYSSDKIIRVSMNGNNILRFGDSGTGAGELLGPQFLADDGENHIYVTESGNSRISKFDYEGNFIFSFGKRNEYFEGFRSPTGIVYFDEKVLAADLRKQKLYLFDAYGNFLNSYKSELLISPEGISVYSENEFLIADGNRVLLFNILDESFRVFFQTEQNSRLIMASRDVNGNIVAADFNGNRITLFTDLTRMYTGLNITIDRILSDNFPEILVELSVSTVDGSAYVGLEENNFLLTEDSYSNYGMSLIASGNKTDFVEISYLVEGSESIQEAGDVKVDGIRDLLGTMAGRGSFSIVSAEELPVLEVERGSDFNVIAESLSADGNYSKNWSFDLGLRLAASHLMGGGARKAVVFLSSGHLNSTAFSRYNLTETLDYLINNNIVFYTAYINQEDVSPELDFLSKQTGGLTLPLYGPSGIKEVVDHLRARPLGAYTLRFRTARDSDFGRRSLPVEVQVSLFDRSGKDSSIYYGPAE